MALSGGMRFIHPRLGTDERGSVALIGMPLCRRAQHASASQTPIPCLCGYACSVSESIFSVRKFADFFVSFSLADDNYRACFLCFAFLLKKLSTSSL